MNGFNYGTWGEELFIATNPYPGAKIQKRVYGPTPLSKLHGSISWDKERKYGDCRCGLNGRALIVPPSREKQPPPDLLFTWDLAAKMLAESQGIIVFGFSFNPIDMAVLDMLKVAGSNIDDVLIINPSIDEKRVDNIWTGSHLTKISSPDAGKATLLAWVKRMTG